MVYSTETLTSLKNAMAWFGTTWPRKISLPDPDPQYCIHCKQDSIYVFPEIKLFRIFGTVSLQCRVMQNFILSTIRTYAYYEGFFFFSLLFWTGGPSLRPPPRHRRSHEASKLGNIPRQEERKAWTGNTLVLIRLSSSPESVLRRISDISYFRPREVSEEKSDIEYRYI
jgi:hypothetical protein